MIQENQEDKVLKFLKEAFKDVFPNYPGPDSVFQVDGHTISGTISDLSLQGSKLHYDYSQKSLFHFTTIGSAKSILDSETLWLSNFNSFRDKKDFLHAAEHIFNIEEPDAFKLKDGLFALSLTEANLTDLYSGPYNSHWQNYASSHTGVALEFVIRHPLPPDFYSLKVKYQDIPQKESNLENVKSAFNKYSGNFNPNSVLEFLYPIFCAYKLKKSGNENYELEKEVRLLYSDTNYYDKCSYANSEHSMTGYATRFRIDENRQPIFYLNLPISFPKKENAEDVLLLKAVHFGKQALKSDSDDIRNYNGQLIINFFIAFCNNYGVKLNMPQ